MSKPKLVPKESLDEIDFTQSEIDRFIQFAVTLKRIHVRMIVSGYKINDGEIIEPELFKVDE